MLPITHHPSPITAFIALGSNLQDPLNRVKRGFEELARLPGTRLTARSSLYRSAPVGGVPQPDYINAAAQIETLLSPRDLMNALLEIEKRNDRVRSIPNAPRTLDLDVLLYGKATCQEPGLTIPHPRMHERAFVLWPLLEIAPDCVIPGRGRAADWLPGCSGQVLQRLSGD